MENERRELNSDVVVGGVDDERNVVRIPVVYNTVVVKNYTLEVKNVCGNKNIVEVVY